MSRSALSLIAAIVGIVLLSGSVGFSQTPSSNSSLERRKAIEEREAKQRMKLETSNQNVLNEVQATAARRASCLKEAKERGLSFYNRGRYVKRCMAR